MDKRFNLLASWVARQTGQPVDFTPLFADASHRRYYRVDVNSATLVAVDTPVQLEDPKRFVELASAFRRMGLNVPEIHAQDLTDGFLLLEDFGDQHYYGALDAQSADTLYRAAIDALVKLQASSPQLHSILEDYDEDLLRFELSLFPEWCLETHLEKKLQPAEKTLIENAFDVLTRNALEQPRLAIHRDFHSRNLMIQAKNNPGIIDFQGALWGPLTYDLVSLLRDCYIDWPETRLRKWISYYCQRAIDMHVLGTIDPLQFQRWFDLCGMQRHLKAIGIFCRLKHRDQRPQFLADVPRVWNYIVRAGGKYDELLPFTELLENYRRDFDQCRR